MPGRGSARASARQGASPGSHLASMSPVTRPPSHPPRVTVSLICSLSPANRPAALPACHALPLPCTAPAAKSEAPFVRVDGPRSLDFPCQAERAACPRQPAHVLHPDANVQLRPGRREEKPAFRAHVPAKCGMAEEHIPERELARRNGQASGSHEPLPESVVALTDARPAISSPGVVRAPPRSADTSSRSSPPG